MREWIIQIMNQYGYLGIMLLIALENVFPPIPSELILTFGGFMTSYTNINIWGVILFSTMGSLFGAIILYGAGRMFSRERLEGWLDGRMGKILHFDKKDVNRTISRFEKWGNSAVFFCRFIPIVRSLISIPAGISKMDIPSFLVLTAMGSLLWNTALVYLGLFAGSSWEKIAGYMNLYSSVFLVLFAVSLLIMLLIFLRKRLTGKD